MSDTKIKLVLTDMDDTIVSHAGHDVSEAVRNAIIAVENQGVIVTPVTGRSYEFAKPILNVLGVSGPCVLDGGASVIDSETGKILWKKWLSAKQVRELVELSLPFSKRLLFISGSNEAHSMAIEDIELSLINEESPSILAFFDDVHEEAFAEMLSTMPDVTFYFFLGSVPETGERIRAVQICHQEATKHHGVEALRKMRHVPKEQTLAIGDGDNDVALFQSAGIKIAVGNATDKLKALADDVVASQEEDGFVEAMNKYVLHK